MSEQRPENPGELNFYYNREERLKNALRTVKDFYSGKMKTPPRGLIKVLVATKGSRIIFLTLVFASAATTTAATDAAITEQSSFDMADPSSC